LERWFEVAAALPEPCFSAVILNDPADRIRHPQSVRLPGA
jgi:hypothetical protein